MEQSNNNRPNWAGLAEVELVYKSKVKASERPKVNCSKDIYDVLRKVWDDNKIDMIEEFKVVLLNRANRVIGIYEASSGGLTGTVADPRLILAAAIKSLAVSIIISHNHPSGNLQPSKADDELTQKIKQAAIFHDIKLLDHIVLSSESYYSFADEGVI